MAKEILLYNPIFNFTAETFIEQMNDFQGEDLTIRVNSPGGSVYSGWGMIAKMQEHTAKLTIKVDGTASSMGAVMLLFASSVEAIEQSHFMLHRADSFSKSEDTLKELKKINTDFRKAFEARLDVEAFEKIAGITLDDFFNSDEQIDVNLNAKEAKKIGLISKIIKMEASQFEALNMKFAAMAKADSGDSVNDEEKNTNPQKIKKMDLNMLKAEHPAVYAEAVAIGEKAGISAEQDRVGSFMEFVEIDAKGVAEGIESGNALSAKAAAGFMKAQFAAEMIAGAEDDSVPAVTTPNASAPKTEAELKADEAILALDKELGINQKETK